MKFSKISDLFNVKYGVNLELNALKLDPDGVNFVSRTAKNNGVSAKVRLLENVHPIPAGVLTVAGGGSVLETFLQPEPFYSGRDLYYLVPKVDLTKEELLYYCQCIRANKYRYNYGRQANRTLKDILIPTRESIPSWVYKSNLNLFDGADKPNSRLSTPNLNIQKWEKFKITDIFTKIESCKCKKASDLKSGDDIYYVGAKKSNNGLMRKVVAERSLVTKGNCIIFICDGQGSVGYSNYMDKDFIGSTTLSVGYFPNLNPYIGLFLVSVLDLERPKYSFGRKYRKGLSTTEIKLPVNKDGSPDWVFMENYIKSLPYSSQI